MLSSILPTKPAPEEIQKAAPLRQAGRQKVLDTLNIFNKNEKAYKDAGLTDSDLKPLKSYLESELAWWNANLELTTLQVQTRQTSFQETLPVKQAQVGQSFQTLLQSKSPQEAQKLLNTFPKDSGFVVSDKLQQDIRQKQESVTLDQQKQQEKLENRTALDDIYDALKYALLTCLIISYICVALRFAGFAANDLLYKSLPYRALAFVYTFLFTPILGFYYVYREIMAWFYPSDEYKPHFESLFPVVPYDPSEPLTFAKRLYGYADTPALRSWMLKKQEEERQSWLQALQGSVLSDLIQAKEKEIQ